MTTIVKHAKFIGLALVSQIAICMEATPPGPSTEHTLAASVVESDATTIRPAIIQLTDKLITEIQKRRALSASVDDLIDEIELLARKINEEVQILTSRFDARLNELQVALQVEVEKRSTESALLVRAVLSMENAYTEAKLRSAPNSPEPRRKK